jgi:hypothetical protein
MTEQPDLDFDAPRDPARTIAIAELITRCVRLLTYTTCHHDALTYPSELDRVLRELIEAADGMDQLIQQLGEWLAKEHRAGHVALWEESGFGRDPRRAVKQVVVQLDEAGKDLRKFAAHLRFAGNATCDMETADASGSDHA